MKMLKYGLAVALLGSASHAFAQVSAPYAQDALRFSQSGPAGTARTLGLGGASAAVGGDYGSVSVNPAGLGMFQRSEFAFSPGLSSLTADGEAFGTRARTSRSNLHVASLGLVLAHRRPDGDGSPWRSGAFALGLTRTADFNRSFRYGGRPAPNQDILQRLGEDQGLALDDLAYNAYLTESDAQGTYIPEDFFYTGDLNQAETVRLTGSSTQFDLSYGASYLDKLYLGGGIGVVSSRYNSENTLTASSVVANDPNSAFGSLSQRETVQTRGGGINARIGLIYRPVDAVRIGASVQTPTYFQLEETYNSSLQAQFNRPVEVEAGDTRTSTSSALEPEYLSYTLTTPFKATGGLAVVIGKYGFVSGDVEYLDYSQASLSNNSNGQVSSNHDFNPDNDEINNAFGSAVNLRVGGELRLDAFRVRAGYARYGDALQNNTADQSRTYYTGGLGVRQNNFFLDFAGVYGKSAARYAPYTIYSEGGETPIVNINDKRFTVTATAGFMF